MCRLNILLLMLVVIPTRGQTEEPPRPNAEAKPDAAESLLQPIPEDPEAREKLATQVRALLKQLADDAFATREAATDKLRGCLLYTSPSPRDQRGSRMPSSA